MINIVSYIRSFKSNLLKVITAGNISITEPKYGDAHMRYIRNSDYSYTNEYYVDLYHINQMTFVMEKIFFAYYEGSA